VLLFVHAGFERRPTDLGRRPLADLLRLRAPAGQRRKV